jgi:hypothetical protein
VDHNVRAVLLCTRLGHLAFAVGALTFVHFHVVVSTLFTLLFFIFTLGVFNVDLLAAGLGLCILIVCGSSSVFTTSHGSVIALYRSGLGLLLFILFLLDAVLVAVCVEVGLGLLGWELWWGRLLGIPIKLAMLEDMQALPHTT